MKTESTYAGMPYQRFTEEYLERDLTIEYYPDGLQSHKEVICGRIYLITSDPVKNQNTRINEYFPRQIFIKSYSNEERIINTAFIAKIEVKRHFTSKYMAS